MAHARERPPHDVGCLPAAVEDDHLVGNVPPDGPVVPGSVPLFPERLLSQFAGQSSPPVFQTADGDEYRWCETSIEVGSAGKAWPLLTRPCQPPPEPPIKDTTIPAGPPVSRRTFSPRCVSYFKRIPHVTWNLPLIASSSKDGWFLNW